MSVRTLRGRNTRTDTASREAAAADPPTSASPGLAPPAPAGSPIADARWRESVRVTGRVRSVRIQPWADVATLECTLVDETGGLTVVFLGRRKVAGIHPGARMRVEGVVGAHHEKLAMLNPDYALLDA